MSKVGRTLLGMVERKLVKGFFDVRMRELTRIADKDQDLNDNEIKEIYEYLAECMRKEDENGRSDMSIREMKETLLDMIGAGALCSRQSTVSRTELHAIYRFVVQLPADVFLGTGEEDED